MANILAQVIRPPLKKERKRQVLQFCPGVWGNQQKFLAIHRKVGDQLTKFDGHPSH
jgi:hypothetical protein